MGERVNKSKLVHRVSKDCEIQLKAAHRILDCFLDLVKDGLEKNHRIKLTGFGSFKIVVPSRKSFVKPNTGEKISVTPKAKVVFNPSKEFADRVNKYQPMSEKRKLKRRNFIFDIEVIDRNMLVNPDNEDHVMGDLADITVEGVMVVSESPIEEKKVYRMRIVLPEEINGQKTIDFDAESIQCNKTIHESIYTTGFRIVKLDQKNYRTIDTLIREFAV